MIVSKIIDKHLDRIVRDGLNSLPIDDVAPEMLDQLADNESDWQSWLPIPSQITTKEIDEFEEQIGHKLPASYRAFLQHKHFYELTIDEASFCQHPIRFWRSAQTDLIYDSYPREFLIDRGYIPFAQWSDWGLLCFDTTSQADKENYPVVQWDHEMYDQFTFFSSDFESMIVELDKRDEKNGS